MSKAPAFQFYANDFMDATRLWEANAVGLYIRCLCIQWTHGSIPSDLKLLARAIHCERAELESCWVELREKFIDQGDGTLKNSRLEVVRERQEQVSEVRSRAGKAGAIAKANASHLLQAKHKQRKVKEKEKVEGEEGGGEGEPTIYPQDFPPAMCTPEALSAWSLWERSRQEKKKPITPVARQLQLADCEKWGTERSIAACLHSAKGNYQGLFEPHLKATTPTERSKATIADRNSPIPPTLLTTKRAS